VPRSSKVIRRLPHLKGPSTALSSPKEKTADDSDADLAPGWATHDGSLSPQTQLMKQERDRAVDAMGNQMASQFPDFSVPNSPDPPEQTKRSKL
jgi:hypothetical protein